MMLADGRGVQNTGVRVAGRVEWANALDWEAPAAGAVTLPATHHVLVVFSAQSRNISLSDRLVTSEQHAHLRYHVTFALMSPDEVRRLDAIAGTTPPRAILLDVAALDQPDAVDMLHNLRRRLPGTRLLLGWPRVDSTLDAALLTQFDGSLTWSQFGHLERALDAILAGELWFPRAVMQAMYRYALSSVRGLPGTTRAGKTTETGVSLARRESDASVSLTQRESDAYVLMRRGLTNTQIADRLKISINTVKKHLSRVFEKRGLSSRRQVVD